MSAEEQSVRTASKDPRFLLRDAAEPMSAVPRQGVGVVAASPYPLHVQRVERVGVRCGGEGKGEGQSPRCVSREPVPTAAPVTPRAGSV